MDSEKESRVRVTAWRMRSKKPSLFGLVGFGASARGRTLGFCRFVSGLALLVANMRSEYFADELTVADAVVSVPAEVEPGRGNVTVQLKR